MITFVHAGLPKTLSSALQRSFFPNHPDIHYLGVGSGGDIGWRNADCERIFEELLLYARDAHYREQRDWARSVLAAQKREAETAGKGAFGLSSEWFSLTLSPDMIDIRTRFERLADLLGDDTRVILLLRNQAELVRSLYGQYVREGMTLDYEAFLDYLHDYRDRNFFHELCYDTVLDQLSRCFGRERVFLRPLERYRDEEKNLGTESSGRIGLIDAVCDLIEVEYPADFRLPQVNPSLSAAELNHKLAFNREHPHDFGRSPFEPANPHRIRPYLDFVEARGVPDPFGDVKRKREGVEWAMKRAAEDPAPISYAAKPETVQRLRVTFEAANRRFAKASGIALPEAYFELRF